MEILVTYKLYLSSSPSFSNLNAIPPNIFLYHPPWIICQIYKILVRIKSHKSQIRLEFRKQLAFVGFIGPDHLLFVEAMNWKLNRRGGKICIFRFNSLRFGFEH